MFRTTCFAACAAALALAAPAHAAGDYVAIVQETEIAAPAETAWAKVKGYCDIGAWLKTTCEITSGKDGELGAVRTIAGRVVEVIVAVTPIFNASYSGLFKIFWDVLEAGVNSITAVATKDIVPRLRHGGRRPTHRRGLPDPLGASQRDQGGGDAPRHPRAAPPGAARRSCRLRPRRSRAPTTGTRAASRSGSPSPAP